MIKMNRGSNTGQSNRKKHMQLYVAKDKKAVSTYTCTFKNVT